MNERERAPLKREANQGIEAMTEQLTQHKEKRSRKSRLYPEVSNELKIKALDAAIAQQQELLTKADKRGKIDLNDIEAVKKICNDYFESCRRSQVIPSMTALAPALGISRQRLYAYIRYNDTPSSHYLDTVRSAISAIVEQAGLTRSASEALAIFILKNSVDMADKVDITAIAEPKEPDRFENMTADEIEKWFTETYGPFTDDSNDTIEAAFEEAAKA